MKKALSVLVVTLFTAVFVPDTFAQNAAGTFEFSCSGLQTAAGTGTLLANASAGDIEGYTHVNDAVNSQARGLTLRVSVKRAAAKKAKPVRICSAWFRATDPVDPDYNTIIGQIGDENCTAATAEGAPIFVSAQSGPNQAMPGSSIGEYCSFKFYLWKVKRQSASLR